VQLAVLEGRVSLDGAGGQQVVEAGEVSLVQAGDTPTAPRAADVQEMVEWMGDVLIFQDTPLRQAALEIERKFDVRVRISDEALADRTLTAAFEGQDLATVVATVCRVVDARCQTQDSVVVVQP
jgi:ferric-dicitrate binding protein FerR (iron transport regulator)